MEGKWNLIGDVLLDEEDVNESVYNDSVVNESVYNDSVVNESVDDEGRTGIHMAAEDGNINVLKVFWFVCFKWDVIACPDLVGILRSCWAVVVRM